MANEIYHRSNWGNAVNDIAWGDTYEKFDATNEMFVRSDNYENSNETDKLMAAINPKPSILLTPTAYDNGSLHSVKPLQTLGSELVTNGDFATDSDWSKGTGWTISGGTASCDGSQSGNSNFSQSNVISDQSKTYRVEFTLSNYAAGSVKPKFGNATQGANRTANGTYVDILSGMTTNQLTFTANSDFVGSIDNVSVKEVIDADFDFTRGSSATRLRKDGLIEDVQILSGELVQNGDFEQIGSELVTNGSFDTDSDWNKGTGWSISGGSANCDGTQTSQTTLESISNLALGSDNLFKITFNISNYSSGQIDLITLVGTGGPEIQNINANGSYTAYSFGKSTGNARIQIIANSDFIGSIDNVSVKEVGQNWSSYDGNVIFKQGSVQIDTNGTAYTELRAGNDFNSPDAILTIGNKYRLTYTISEYNSGEIKTNSLIANDTILTSTVGTHTIEGLATLTSLGILRNGDTDITITNISVIEITDDTNLPRIDYTDGTGSLLLEPQSTNLLENSEITSTWNYTEFGSGSTGTITTGKTDMFGGTNAVQIDFPADAENVTLDFGQTTSSASSGSVSGSVYIKLVQSGSKTLQLRCSSSLTTLINVDETKFVRYELSGTKSASEAFSLKLRPSAGTSSGGFSIIVCQPQEEALSFPTSYIPTSGSTVTRSADVCNNSGSSDLINSTSGVLYAEIAALVDDATRRTISISDGTTSNRVMLRYDNASNRVQGFIQVGGATNGNINTNSYTITNFLKIAYKWKGGDFALWVNGSKAATSSDATSFSADTLTVIDFDTNNSARYFGKVKCVAVFKEALTDEELTCLTT